MYAYMHSVAVVLLYAQCEHNSKLSMPRTIEQLMNVCTVVCINTMCTVIWEMPEGTSVYMYVCTCTSVYV